MSLSSIFPTWFFTYGSYEASKMIDSQNNLLLYKLMRFLLYLELSATDDVHAWSWYLTHWDERGHPVK